MCNIWRFPLEFMHRERHTPGFPLRSAIEGVPGQAPQGTGPRHMGAGQEGQP